MMIQKIAPQIFDVNVRKIKDFGNETRHYELSLEDGKSMKFIPGQFVSIIYYPENGKVIRRAYSIASPPQEKKQIDLCLKLVPGGKVTTWFWAFHEGKQIQVHGPFGKFVLPSEINYDLIFIATGTGIAPFRSMIRDLLHRGFERNIWLLFGTRSDKTIPYHEEWELLASYYPQFHYIPTISRPSAEWKGETGYVQTKIATHFPKPDGKLIYICGLNQMIQAVQDECLKRGFDKERIHYERFD